MSSHPEQTTAVRPILLRLATAALVAVAVGTAAAPPTGAEAAVAAPDPARFSTTIDNPFLPLAPGTVLRTARPARTVPAGSWSG